MIQKITDTTASTHQQVLAKIPGLLAHRMLQTHSNFSQTNVTSQLRQLTAMNI